MVLSLVLSVALSSAPPGAYCSQWSGRPVDPNTSPPTYQCFCISPKPYYGPACLECSFTQLEADGGLIGASCTRLDSQGQGCAALPGEAWLLAALPWLLRRRRVCP